MSVVRYAPAALLLALAACGSDPETTTPLAPYAAASRVDAAGAVVVASNAPDGNALLVFPRGRDGRLGAPSAVPTGGRGTGGGLGNQGGLIQAGPFVLAVNAGSNDVSVFRRRGNSLELTDRQPSGGLQPISITAHGALVYVLNAGGAGNIAGFLLRENGRLLPLAHSSRPLSGSGVGPAQIGFSPDGTRLVVTEKNANLVTTYALRGFLAGEPVSHPSAGQTPFGFAFDRRGDLLVSEASGGAPDGSALSSYRLGLRNDLRVIAPSVGTTETAACWVVVTPDGHFAYVTNNGSASVSGYRIGQGGRLTLLNADGVTGRTGAGPIDLAFADAGMLYTLDSDAHGISGFERGADGGLTTVEVTAPLPVGANGMVAW